MISDILSAKIEDLLGSGYKIFPISHFNKNYTEARQYIEGDNISYFRYYNSDYGKFRKNKVVGIVTISNAIRNNSNAYYLSSSYTIDFSVPRNMVKTDKDGVILEETFDFNSDIDDLISTITNQKIAFDTTYSGKMTMSEPSFVTTEKDGELSYDIMRVSGSIVITDSARFGSDYKVEMLINGEYYELDDINNFTEILSTDNNAIVKSDKTRVEQDLAQSGWTCAVTIDDYQSTNPARQKIYEIVHLNQEIVNASGSTEALKRKVMTRITTPSGVHLFNAVVNVTFVASRNGVGNYNVSFTDDNKPLTNYTLSFNSNGGSAVASKIVYDEDKIGIIATTIKTGYTLVNWLIDSEPISANSVYKYKADKTAIASWVANTYEVRFNANGGSGSMSNQEFTYDIAENLNDNLFTRTGYTFKGWATSKNGQKVYDNQQEVLNLTNENNGIVDLYAVWELGLASPEITISGTGTTRTITLTSVNSGDTIYYYIGSDDESYPATEYPMPTGTAYSEPITITTSTTTYYTIQAVCRKNGEESSMSVNQFSIIGE